MHELSMVILLLATGGHWFGGSSTWIELAWRLPNHAPSAIVEWSLEHERWRLMDGKTDLPTGVQPVRIVVQAPEVRAETSLTWSYTLRERDTGRVLETGERFVRLYPPQLGANLLPYTEGELVLMGAAESRLTRAFDAAGVRYRLQDTVPQVAGQQQVYVVVLPERELSAFEQASALAFAAGGGRMLVLSNRPTTEIFGCAVERVPPRPLQWTGSLLTLPAAGLIDDWLRGVAHDIPALRIASHDAARADGLWLSADPKSLPSHVLALLRPVERGAILLAPMPLDDHVNDPRAQFLLRSLLDTLRGASTVTAPGVERRLEREISYAR